MARQRDGKRQREESEEEEERTTCKAKSNRDDRKSKWKVEDSDSKVTEPSESVEDRRHYSKTKKSGSKRMSRRRSSDEESGRDSDSDSSSYESGYSDSGSDSEDIESESESENEEERKRRKRRERRKREEKKEKERKRRKRERERKKRKREEEDEKRKKKKSRDKKKTEKGKGKTGAVTNSWGKYGIIREIDMWNKRPEFTAWLAEVKQVNLESLPNWEEKKMFKEFMEDYNTATLPSKKYYDLDVYHRRKMEKELKKGFKVVKTERTVFNDEEQRRQELLQEREKQKQHQVEALKYAMQSGMAQAMKEQALLREEMAYQYKLGNFEAAAAIQRKLDPDAAM
ncbi:hypothetical protein Nepgr_016174 [Nepenthes gracilis]|uniref:Uncharacterized protein n=1 Tax=Nepenthes gracilis TaxID=150966 RepID=A0AAD3SN28_NEPGR|nr:hypothetical protein Nepgr_016174 [Nepenthes gracilis]